MRHTGLQGKLEQSLAYLARRIIAKYRPDVIAVTGSVGKTSVKEAIFTVLSGQFAIRRSQGNLNNELGVPLSIIGRKSGGRNPFAWLGVFNQALRLILRTRPYPECLILEMAADHPGDLAELAAIARPRVSVTTAVAPVHTEYFRTLEAVAEEKRTLAQATDPDGYAILNADDPMVINFRKNTEARVLTYGLSDEADVRASDLGFITGKAMPGSDIPEFGGVHFRLHFDGRTLPVRLPNSVGKPLVSAALAGAAVGFVYNRSLADVNESLLHFSPPRGRSRLIPGLRGSLLIDDSYNASPRAVIAALELLTDLFKECRRSNSDVSFRRIAVLGDMAELGPYSEMGHREVGRTAAKQVDILYTVGEQAKQIAEAARTAGLAAKVIHEYPTAEVAANDLRSLLQRNDICLIKGSQSVRLERVVRTVLAEPDKAAELLVRQGSEWKK